MFVVRFAGQDRPGRLCEGRLASSRGHLGEAERERKVGTLSEHWKHLSFCARLGRREGILCGIMRGPLLHSSWPS